MTEAATVERRRAEAMARDIVIPPRGDAHDHAVPLTRGERYRVDSLVERLTARPGDVRGDIRNVAALVDDVGHTSGGIALGLNEELAELARRHPREFVEETGGDLAEQTREAIIDSMRLPASAREGVKARARMIRDELAGPKSDGRGVAPGRGGVDRLARLAPMRGEPGGAVRVQPLDQGRRSTTTSVSTGRTGDISGRSRPWRRSGRSTRRRSRSTSATCLGRPRRPSTGERPDAPIMVL